MTDEVIFVATDGIYSGDGTTINKISTHGGKRPGAGRPRSNQPRCACDAMTLKRAIQTRHKCKTEQAVTSE